MELLLRYVCVIQKYVPNRGINTALKTPLEKYKGNLKYLGKR
jgi:hypothetical protein